MNEVAIYLFCFSIYEIFYLKKVFAAWITSRNQIFIQTNCFNK